MSARSSWRQRACWTSSGSARDFPILERSINGHPLVYLDSAATSQKPRQVIDAVSDFYANHNANAHRGIYTLGEESTEAFEGARAKLAGVLRRSGPPHDRVHPRDHRIAEPRRAGVGAEVPEGGRRGPPHRHGAPLEHRALAAHGAGDRRGPPLHPAHRRRAARPLGARLAAERADQDPVGDRDVQRPRDDHAARPARRGRPRGRRARRGGRRAARAAQRGLRQPSWTATSSRSAATRCSGPRRAAVSTRRPSSSRRWTRCSAAGR